MGAYLRSAFYYIVSSFLYGQRRLYDFCVSVHVVIWPSTLEHILVLSSRLRSTTYHCSAWLSIVRNRDSRSIYVLQMRRMLRIKDFCDDT